MDEMKLYYVRLFLYKKTNKLKYTIIDQRSCNIMDDLEYAKLVYAEYKKTIDQYKGDLNYSGRIELFEPYINTYKVISEFPKKHYIKKEYLNAHG